jgi:hypothetical protein
MNDQPSRLSLDPPAYSVAEWCAAHRVARSYFYLLIAQGRAPAIYRLGRRVFISGEAAAKWRLEQQQASEAGHS